MRISVVSHGRFVNDPRGRALARTLSDVGHDVTIVAAGKRLSDDVDGVPIVYVPTRFPQGGGRRGRILRRLQPKIFRQWLHRRQLVQAVRATSPDTIYPVSGGAVDTATKAAGSSATVVRDPQWSHAGMADLIDLAVTNPELSQSPAGPGGVYLTPADQRPPSRPRDGRHVGHRMALCYRKTDSNPGKYLEAALRRAGIEVDLHTDSVDFDSLHPDTNSVVFVEGPYPALSIHGTPPSIPIAFWTHHGEHHCQTNIRLAWRYHADAVLLAHSWHMAQRFPVPVHRFPFGVATELLDPSKPWSERDFDVSMVGGQLRRKGGTYERRQQIVADLEEALGAENCAFEAGVDADYMAELYGNARIIVNEGGVRHYPITMRVLEAVGAGALLLTDDLPGTDQILKRGAHYEVLQSDVVAQVKRLLADPVRNEKRARAALEHARDFQMYEHRVDDLMEILAGVDVSKRPHRDNNLSPMAALVDSDVEVNRVAVFGMPGLGAELRTREIWDGEEMLHRLGAGGVEAVVFGPNPTSHFDVAVRAARRYVYAAAHQDDVRSYFETERPIAEFHQHGDLLRVDLWAESYRIESPEVQQARLEAARGE